MPPTEDDTAHTISLLACLDLKRTSPDGLDGPCHTCDSNASTDPSAGFVYPGMNDGGGHMGDESASGARI